MPSGHSVGSLIIVEGMMDQCNTHLSSPSTSIPECALFYLKTVASTSRTKRSVIQLTVRACFEEHQGVFTVHLRSAN
ncbi:hypothetical protein TNIN_89041 [Trichonephila inaurata madagascariensis]|uniref:Uncharacterized protein n=1 Tax=Trichonephila inaurata madagascariensis TaxID=2747483 RepID=A0A8X6YXE0_9ARAC|nr:hypothetical protein TNIN_89041 [Trichonephila inaurata madagascariensis]